MVTKEVGGLSEARRLPTEVRRWWIQQIIEERQPTTATPEPSGNRIRTVDVPRTKK